MYRSRNVAYDKTSLYKFPGIKDETSQYNYNFSPELLAKYPADNRDESRLMVVERKTGKIEHRIFKEIIDYFNEKDVFIFNNTKVFPARLYGTRRRQARK